MSREGRYILSYEYQSYVVPTPMDRDKQTIQKYLSNYWPGEEVKAKFTELDWGHTVHFEMPKYTLPPDILDKLLADRVFEACDGDYYSEVESDHTPAAFSPPATQGDTNLTQPKGSGEQPTSVDQAINKMYVTVEFQNGLLDYGDAAGTIRNFPINQPAREAIKTLVAEERRQAKIELLHQLIDNFEHDTGIEVYLDRIAELRGENSSE